MFLFIPLDLIAAYLKPHTASYLTQGRASYGCIDLRGVELASIVQQLSYVSVVVLGTK